MIRGKFSLEKYIKWCSGNYSDDDDYEHQLLDWAAALDGYLVRAEDEIILRPDGTATGFVSDVAWEVPVEQ